MYRYGITLYWSNETRRSLLKRLNCQAAWRMG